jgi:hypothetical protein
VELLEDRTVLSPYLVTTTADSGPGSLRDAINQVNADTAHALYASPSNPAVDEIDFNITAASDTGGGYNAATGVCTITPLSFLPGLNNAILNGYTQAGATPNDLQGPGPLGQAPGNPSAYGDDAVLKIIVDGKNAGANVYGLQLGDNSTVQGLVIDRFGGPGIGIYGTNAVIQGNFLGVDATGTTAYDSSGNPLGNGYADIYQRFGPPNARIGGPSPAQRNIISGTQQSSTFFPPYPGGNGILLGGTHLNILIQGNFIGTDVTGTKAVDSLGRPFGNASDGISIGSDEITIAGNVIAANLGGGIYGGGVIQGNFIGTDVTGRFALGNSGDGMLVSGGNQIGGVGQGNLISANGSDGVELDGPGNFLQGNYIGTDVTGSYALGNHAGWVGGVRVRSSNNIIGGTTPGAGNVISGNFGGGIGLDGAFASAISGNLIAGNYIGTNAAATAALGNHGAGIGIGLNAPNNTIGGTTTAARNIISANGGDAEIEIYTTSNYFGPTSNNVIEGNYIGTDVTGNMGLGYVHGVIIDGATDTVIGGTAAGAGNLISGGADGILLSVGGPLMTTGTLVQGNYIGTNAAGTAALGNFDGIGINAGATATTIGGTVPGARNVISGNTRQGIDINGNGNVVEGNYIGTDPSGTVAVANGGDGIRFASGAANNTVGGTAAGAGNLISGNSQYGVQITAGNNSAAAPCDNNSVLGNYIGTNAAGDAAIPNQYSGVIIEGGGQYNTIGGNVAGARNIISGNSIDGITISDVGTIQNVVAGNYVGLNVDGSAAVANGRDGIDIVQGAQSNRIGTDGDGNADAAERNVVSGNARNGVIVWGNASQNIVAGNYIGTSADGENGVPNAYGVWIGNGSYANRIGTSGHDADNIGERNVISGNSNVGLTFADSGTNQNTAAGNYIGVDAAGTHPLGNLGDGIDVNGQGNIVGTNGDGAGDASEGNVIAANGGFGVSIYGDGTSQTVVAGNLIGRTDPSEPSSFGNGFGLGSRDGVLIAAPGNRVGTNGDGVSDALERNIISGNARNGILIFGAAAHDNIVAGNYLGTDVTGNIGLGNGLRGVSVQGGAQHTIIGTNGDGVGDANEGNLISANGGNEIAVSDVGTDYTVIAGNLVGTNAAGTAALGNARGSDVLVSNGAQHTRIGTNGDGVSDALERNVMAAGAVVGVNLFGSSYNVVAGNYIGTNAAGNVSGDFGNFYAGVQVWQNVGTRIGVNASDPDPAAERNVISGNAFAGLASDIANNVFGPGGYDGILIGLSTATTIAGNYLGTDASGGQALGNAEAGVYVYQSQNVLVGTNAGVALEANVISGNYITGVTLDGSQAVTVAGNLIGTNAAATGPLGNIGDGVLIYNSSTNNMIGGPAPGAGNVIANNTGAGVDVLDSGSTGNTIRGNSIYSNAHLGIDLGGDGVTLNDSHGHVGPNSFQNYPVLTSATSTGGSLTIAGTLASSPGSTFTIDFYSSSSVDPSGYGQGEHYLGSVPVTTNGSGLASFSAAFASDSGRPFITATATDAAGNTSEFSHALQIRRYSFSGFLSPVSLNRAFKQGSTVPIKWQLTNANGQLVTSLSAVTSLTVTIGSTTYALYSGTTSTSSYTSGGAAFRNDGSQYVFNWSTKGFATGTYTLTAAFNDGSVQSKTIVLSASGATLSLVVEGTASSAVTAGALLAGDETLYIDNSNGAFTGDEQARILDVVAGIEALVSPYGSNIYVVDSSVGDAANIVLTMSSTSAVGGQADGVLGCTSDGGLVTIISGWNWYAGADPTAIGGQQYDFQTVVTHELGHALGLGHSSDATSVMYPNLGTGEIRRTMVAADLNTPDTGTGPSGLHAAPFVPANADASAVLVLSDSQAIAADAPRPDFDAPVGVVAANGPVLVGGASAANIPAGMPATVQHLRARLAMALTAGFAALESNPAHTEFGLNEPGDAASDAVVSAGCVSVVPVGIGTASNPQGGLPAPAKSHAALDVVMAAWGRADNSRRQEPIDRLPSGDSSASPTFAGDALFALWAAGLLLAGGAEEKRATTLLAG